MDDKKFERWKKQLVEADEEAFYALVKELSRDWARIKELRELAKRRHKTFCKNKSLLVKLDDT
jgi:hypothetical protein